MYKLALWRRDMRPMNNFGSMWLTPLRNRLHSSPFSAVHLLVNTISLLRHSRREKCHDPLKNSTFRNRTPAEIALARDRVLHQTYKFWTWRRCPHRYWYPFFRIRLFWIWMFHFSSNWVNSTGRIFATTVCISAIQRIANNGIIVTAIHLIIQARQNMVSKWFETT